MKILLSIIILVSGFNFAFAQEKTIDKTEFEQVRKTAMEILRSKPRRATITSETKVNGEPQKNNSTKTITEVDADRRRTVNEKISGTRDTKNEYVQIGDKAYQRKDNGDWKETKAFDRNQMPRIKIISEESDYKILGTDTIGEQTATIYQRNSKVKKIDTGNNKEISSQESVKYWIGANGELIKREENRENIVDGKTFNFKIIAVIEYLESIQIEAPKTN